MAEELNGKVAAVTGAASGIGLASSEAMLAQGARVVMVDRDEAALKKLSERHGEAVIPLVVNLLDPKDCASLVPRILDKTGKLDILHANAGLYVGGDLVDADNSAIDRMLNLNVNVVMKNVHDALPHMIERRTGDIIVTSSLAAHFPTPWEPVYASSKWAINCFVQTVRRQVFKHGIRVGSISPGPVITALLADWPPEKLKEARESGSLLEASEVANVILFMLTRPRGMTIRDVVMMPTNFDLYSPEPPCAPSSRKSLSRAYGSKSSRRPRSVPTTCWCRFTRPASAAPTSISSTGTSGRGRRSRRR